MLTCRFLMMLNVIIPIKMKKIYLLLLLVWVITAQAFPQHTVEKAYLGEDGKVLKESVVVQGVIEERGPHMNNYRAGRGKLSQVQTSNHSGVLPWQILMAMAWTKFLSQGTTACMF